VRTREPDHNRCARECHAPHLTQLVDAHLTQVVELDVRLREERLGVAFRSGIFVEFSLAFRAFSRCKIDVRLREGVRCASLS